MATLLNERQQEWLRKIAGVRIDALETALKHYVSRDLETLVALKRQIRCILDDARSLSLPAIQAAAERADTSGALDVRSHATMLLTLLRGAIRSAHAHVPPQKGEHDGETGLLSAMAFMRRLDQLENDAGSQAALAAINVTDFEMVRKNRGDEAARELLKHVGGILSRHLRGNDCIAHMRGPEFAIFLPEEDRAGLQAALTRIESVVTNHPLHLPDGTSEPVRITANGSWINSTAVAPQGEASATASDTSPASSQPCVGVLAHSPATGKGLVSMLRGAGFEVVSAGLPGEMRMAPFARKKLHLAFIEESREELPIVLGRLRSSLMQRRTPVVVVVTDAEDGKWAMQQGANEFLLKPLTKDELLKAANRLAKRTPGETAESSPSKSSGVLIASDSVSQLIAIGSSLQRQGGYNVRLGRGGEDAMSQVRRHAPEIAIVDTALNHGSSEALLQCLAELQPAPIVVLLGDAKDHKHAENAKHPRIAGFLPRQVPLLSLHTKLKETTGIAPGASPNESAAVLREEILRVLRTGVST